MKIITILALCWLTLPCNALANNTATNINHSATNQPQVMVTLPPLSGLVALLLPEIKSHCLLSASADPHHFQLSPRQTDVFHQAGLFIRSSYDDQGWNIPDRTQASVDLWSNQGHAWLNFDQVQQVLPRLSQALGKQFPQYQHLMGQRLEQAQKTVQHMQQQWTELFKVIKNKGVMMQHPAWQGLFEAQDVPIWTVLESAQHGHEHGPRHLEQALNTLIKHPQSLLLGDKRHQSRSLSWLAAHHPSKTPSSIIQLDALGQCNQPWQDLMQFNLQRLTSGL